MISNGLPLCLAVIIFITLPSCQKEVTIGNNDFKTLGTSAHDLLSSSVFRSLVVKINYMPGYAPDPTVINNLATFLNTYLDKPGGIRITQSQISASEKSTLTISEIVDIEKRNRPVFTGEGEIAVHILVTDGSFSNNGILATSYWNTSFCVFGKEVFDNSGGVGQVSRTKLFTTLLEHEFGHLLGLVGQGSPMVTDHRDTENGAHCSNPDCLMYHAVETVDGGTATLTIPSLDENCKKDLKANGGK